ncbi:Arv1-like family-domain-containing protein [Talaromyces proteolyticus]|uniref:Protein ARV n=1 Tax=Talaromyces proteolyticus TaxID=1131652 RepID=A0AAD4PTV0_9EURO|nr:Arv1-like family-domain-containing protein [Talaromyces proteolyticus]KAH8691415.1 Arv1-like family-domain-containing protein [Talaromyces proteolyticus]
MPICIECSYPVSHLYTSYSKADDRALGKGVRLTQCPRCKRFADKYVEHDNVVLFIDLVLIKPQVYRHLLFNRLGRDDNKFDRSIIRLGVLLLLFDVYLTWARIEKSSTLASTPLSTAPIIVQYLFFLTLNALATLSHHLVVRFGASLMPHKVEPSLFAGDLASDTPTTPAASTPAVNLSRSPSSHDMLQRPPSPIPNTGHLPPSYWPPDVSPPSGMQTPLRRVSTAPVQVQPLLPPSPPSPNAVSTALFVSSCPKLFPILLVIWGSKETTTPDEASLAGNGATATIVHQAVKTATSSLLSTARLSTHGAAPLGSISGSSDETISVQSASVPFLDQITSLATFLSTFDLHSLVSFFSLGAANTQWVLLNNIEALYILLNCGYLRAVVLAVAGQLARWVVEKTILGLFGIR